MLLTKDFSDKAVSHDGSIYTPGLDAQFWFVTYIDFFGLSASIDLSKWPISDICF